MLADRRRALGEDHTRKVSQLHALLLELLPGGAKKDLSAAQARALLARLRPRDTVGKTRRRLAAEPVGDLEPIYDWKKAADKELKALLAQTGTGLLDLHGIGPSGAARLLVEVGEITRFPDRNHFASWTGTAPVDASSGDHVRHRLSRGGNRQINRVLHTMAVVQLRNDTDGRAHYRRKKASGKSSNEAMRCLKRRLSGGLPHPARRPHPHQSEREDPGGQRGNASDSSATGSQPQHRLFGQATPARHHPLYSRPATSVLTQMGTKGCHVPGTVRQRSSPRSPWSRSDGARPAGAGLARTDGPPCHGRLDVIAAKLAEDYCDHDRGICLIDPPTWTYWVIGGHYRYSLGGLLCQIGNSSLRRMHSLPIVKLDQ